MPDVTWWAHSTCTIDDCGVRFLTDPLFCSRLGHRTPGIRSARWSIPASLRAPLPRMIHRGTKLRPVVTSVPDG